MEEFFQDLLNQQFLYRALIAGAMVGLVCSVTGVFVVLRGLSFIGAGISHSAFAGVAIGLLLGINPMVSSIIFCSLVGLLIGKVSDIGKVKEDTSIGIFLAASMALGILIMSFVESSRTDIVGYLFGSILTISKQDVALTISASLLILVPVLLFLKEFMLVVFDEEQANLAGIPAKAMIYCLLVILAISTVISMRIVGIVLSSALIVAPAASALQFVRDFDRAVLVSALIGIFITEVGIFLSYIFDSAPGATITILATLVFFGSIFIRRTFLESRVRV